MADPSARFGHYLRLGRLGAGGFGDVYLARDERLGRDVALKLLPETLARDTEQMQRFRREALTLASLNHPNIAIIYGFEEDASGALAIALELVDGESLAARLERGALPLPEAMLVCAQIAEALEVAHERGIVHRDLKPGNVMLPRRGLIKVLDFGLARQIVAGGTATPSSPPPAPPTPVTDAPTPGGSLDETLVMPRTPAPDETIAMDPDRTIAIDRSDTARWDSGTPLTMEGIASGTPGYMSPEQVRGANQDQRTDVFAFGCVLYECLTGLKAFPGSSPIERMRAASQHTVELDRLPAGTAPALRDLLERCLEKDPARRLDEIRAARHTLEEALGIRRAAALRAGEVAVPVHLPAPATGFVGRVRERAESVERLAQTRLLTLAGMGGTGKTRLAIEVARTAADAHPDGVWFVDLTAQQHGERVQEAVAQTLGVVEEAGIPLERSLVAHLAERRILLVLDNCEDVLPVVGALATKLLAACPGLRLLATSREPLAVAGEAVVHVPPLGVPSSAAGGAAALAGIEAVRLFTDRAVAARPDFALTEENAGAVAEICRRLDGIPLAIELAAARVRLLSPAQIRDRLGDRFKLLTAGPNQRQQTLRATVQWSVDQLAPDELDLFARLGVFVAPWTLEAAVALAGEDADEFAVLDGLTRLADRSLLVVLPADHQGARYRYLETVRAYALERLAEHGDPATVRDRHLRYFVDAAEASLAAPGGAEQQRWMERLDREHGDLLAAHGWCGQGGGAERALLDLRIVGTLWRFWSARSHYSLARRVLGEALLRPEAQAPSAARAAALVRAGGFALLEGDHEAARPWIEESLAVCRAIGDAKGEARSLSALATIAIFRDDLDEARARSRESLEAHRALGAPRGMIAALQNLGHADLHQGDLGGARAHLEEAVAIARRTGDGQGQALALSDLAWAHIRSGDRDAAREQLTACFELVRGLEARREGAYALEALAGLAETHPDAVVAAKMLGAATALRKAIGSPPIVSEQREQDARLERLRAAAGALAVEQALAEGGREPFEEAVSAALDWLKAGWESGKDASGSTGP